MKLKQLLPILIQENGDPIYACLLGVECKMFDPIEGALISASAIGEFSCIGNIHKYQQAVRNLMHNAEQGHTNSLMSLRILFDRLNYARQFTELEFDLLRVATPQVYMLIAGMTADKPAIYVMWAYTLLYIRVQIKHEVSVNDFLEFFINGFPTEEGYRQAWLSQKVEGVSALDVPRFWKPLMDQYRDPIKVELHPEVKKIITNLDGQE